MLIQRLPCQPLLAGWLTGWLSKKIRSEKLCLQMLDRNKSNSSGEYRIKKERRKYSIANVYWFQQFLLRLFVLLLLPLIPLRPSLLSLVQDTNPLFVSVRYTIMQATRTTVYYSTVFVLRFVSVITMQDMYTGTDPFTKIKCHRTIRKSMLTLFDKESHEIHFDARQIRSYCVI